MESSLATLGCYSIQSNKCIDISPESTTNIVYTIYIYYPVVEKKSKERKKTEIAFSSAVVVGAGAMSYSHNEAQSSSGCNQNAFPVPEIS